MANKKVLSALVRNHPGVLQRVAGLFYRRGYNIETISACATENPKFTRMTIVVVTSDELEMSQVIRQMSKIQDIRRIAILDEEKAIYSESMMVKFRCESDRRTEFLNLAYRNHMNVLYIGDSTVTVTLTGSPDDLDEVLGKFGEYPIVEMTRSGMSAIEASDRPFVEMDDAEFIN
ncbi:MAG: acetolactate synthase small subunit [Clostridia bacterium]|nr:acetolactate synthase small subunit [Clostridia bacterium]MBQ1555539.1 acetolactate synthase small subunit [Clostridia bacterium]MBQ4397288.1 acetolactate synthase small subunit [Clostridia bacterium]